MTGRIAAGVTRGIGGLRGHAVRWTMLSLDADDFIGEDTIAALVSVLAGQKMSFAACPWWHLEKRGDIWDTHPSGVSRI